MARRQKDEYLFPAPPLTGTEQTRTTRSIQTPKRSRTRLSHRQRECPAKEPRHLRQLMSGTGRRFNGGRRRNKQHLSQMLTQPLLLSQEVNQHRCARLRVRWRRSHDTEGRLNQQALVRLHPIAWNGRQKQPLTRRDASKSAGWLQQAGRHQLAGKGPER